MPFCGLPAQDLKLVGGASLLAQLVKNLPASVGDVSSILEPGRSSGGGSGNPLQYSCLGNSMDRGACWATSHGVAKVGHDLAAEQQQPGK